MQNFVIGKRQFHLEKAPFPSVPSERPTVADAFYRLFDAAVQAVGAAQRIRDDVNLSDLGKSEQLDALKPAVMDALGQSAQTLAAGRNSLDELRERLHALQPEKAQSPHDLAMATEIRTAWRALPDGERMSMAKAALDEPREYEGVLMALQASPWPLDMAGGAGQAITAAAHKLAALRDPAQVDRLALLEKAINWTAKGAAQVAAIAKAEIRIADDDLLTHFIDKDDNATLEALGFDPVVIGQTRTRLKAAA